MKIDRDRMNVWKWLARNERAWLRTYDATLKTAQHVQHIGAAVLATQRNIVILHERLKAVEQKTGITPIDPQLIVKDERMNC